MRKFIFLLLAALTIISCTNDKSVAKQDAWSNAQWIAFEQLQDSMLIVPGVHGIGNHLGQKGLKRSVVPMFRKDLNTPHLQTTIL